MGCRQTSLAVGLPRLHRECVLLCLRSRVNRVNLVRFFCMSGKMCAFGDAAVAPSFAADLFCGLEQVTLQTSDFLVLSVLLEEPVL